MVVFLVRRQEQRRLTVLVFRVRVGACVKENAGAFNLIVLSSKVKWRPVVPHVADNPFCVSIRSALNEDTHHPCVPLPDCAV